MTHNWQVALLSLAVGGGLLGACSNAEEEKRVELRKQILRGHNLEKEQNELREKTRVTTYDGDLIPSETKVAGIVIPRGFEPKFDVPFEWYFDGAQPLGKLEKYLRERIEAESVEHPDAVSTQFTRARTKGDAEMKSVLIKIYPVPGRSDWSRINVVAPRPIPEHIPSPEEVAAQMAQKRLE